MARTDNLNNYLTDIATAIKTKKGDETPINASKFDEEIANLPSGGGTDEYFVESIKVTSSGFISRCLKKIPLIDTSQVTTMNYGFRYCSSLTTIPLLNTSNVTNMTGMFSDCSSLTTIPLLNTSKVTYMDSMFSGCSSLETVPLLNTSNVTTMGSMFSACSKLTEIPNFNTQKVTSFNNAFNACSSLTTIPLLNAQKVTNISYAFANCRALENLGGLYNLGEAFKTTTSANNSSCKLDLSSCYNLTHDSLMNVINNLYDIASIGVQTQQLVLGNTNKNKLTAEEINIAVEKGFSVS